MRIARAAQAVQSSCPPVSRRLGWLTGVPLVSEALLDGACVSRSIAYLPYIQITRTLHQWGMYQNPVVSCDYLCPPTQDKATITARSKCDPLTAPPSPDSDVAPAYPRRFVSYDAPDKSYTAPQRAGSSSGDSAELSNRRGSCTPCAGCAGDTCRYAIPPLVVMCV